MDASASGWEDFGRRSVDAGVGTRGGREEDDLRRDSQADFSSFNL